MSKEISKSGDGILEILLKESNLGFESLLNHLPCYVYWKDINFVYQGCNQLAAELVGLNVPAEIVGKTDNDFSWDLRLVQELRNIDKEIIEIRKPRLDFEASMDTPEGNIYFSVNKVPIFDSDGEVRGILDTYTNITARKKAEKKVLPLDYVVSHLPCYVYWKDCNCIYQGCNDITAALLGLPSREAIVGMADQDFGWDTERVQAYRKIDEEIIQTGKSKLNFEEIVRSSDGKEVYLIVNKVPITDEEGNVLGILGISTDSTFIKEAEKKILEANASKSRFLSAIDRMVRNPLSCVLGAAQLLQGESLNEQQGSIVDTVIDSAKEITPMLDRVRSYLDLEDASLENVPNTFELRKFFESYVEKYQQTAKEKSLKFLFEYDSILPSWVRGGSAFLSQILHNLLGNALKYTSKGYIRLAVNMLALMKEEVTLEVIVEDTGQGIRKETQDCLFNLFERNLSSPEKFTEPGLSLSISAKMVEIMGGAIMVNSNVNKGTTFTLRIPFGKVEKPSYDTTRSYKDYLIHRKELCLKRARDSHINILIIEDNPVAMRVLKMMLERHYHCTIHGVYTLKDALKQNLNAYDIVFVDINLPDGTGIDFIEKSSQVLTEKTPPMVAVTSYVAEDEKTAVIEAGASDVISKPVDMDTLISVVDAYVFEDSSYRE